MDGIRYMFRTHSFSAAMFPDEEEALKGTALTDIGNKPNKKSPKKAAETRWKFLESWLARVL